MTEPDVVVLRCPHPHSRCGVEFTAEDVAAARDLVYGHLRDQHWWGHGLARQLADGAVPVATPRRFPVLDGPQPEGPDPARQRSSRRDGPSGE